MDLNPASSPHSSSSSSVSEPDIEALEQAVKRTNTLSAHINLINGLRQAANLTRLREALQDAYAVYPLPESIWLNYLTDETTLATTAQSRNLLLSLHSRALSDFSTPALHAKRLVFAASLLSNAEIDEDHYKQFVHDAKLHGAGYNPDFKELCKGLPLVDTMFETPPTESTIFAQRLQQTPPATAGIADETRIAAYTFFANFAEAYPDFAVSVYETALSETFFSPQLWKQYDQFLCNNNHPLRSDVLRRACRMLPHHLDLWRRAITIAELDHFISLIDSVKPYVMQSHDLRTACRLTKEVWNRFLALGAPARALQQVMSSLEFNVAESVEWASASCHAAGVLIACGESEKGEKLVDDIVKIRTEARWWLRYAEMVTGDKRRGIYERALRDAGSLEDVYVVRDAWEIFEISGSADSIVERMQAIADIVGVREGEKMKTPAERRHGKAAKRKRGERVGKGDSKGEGKAGAAKEKTVTVENGEVDKMEEDEKEDTKGTEKGSGNVRGKGAAKGKKRDGGVEPKTIFVNNLAFSVNETDLREEFSFAGTIKEIRLPKRSDGATKGMAYIEFGDDAAVAKALTKNNTPMKGRAVWVKRSRPPRKSRREGGRGMRGRRVMIDVTRDGGDGDVVMEEGGLKQEDFRKMLGK